ncbi:hypothetical protein SDC9_128925 [bioreactor metagenome]|uniref:Uncharacterized protein n=1 Tax=bioreactor metagenome TaxID=1076179 RepID=A0A645CYE8_9ZZZZ
MCVLRHLGNGVSVCHRQVYIQRQCRAGHVDLYAAGPLLGIFLIHQVGHAAAHTAHHPRHTLDVPDGSHRDGGDDFLSDIDTAVFLRQGHVFPALAHGIHAPSRRPAQSRAPSFVHISLP